MHEEAARALAAEARVARLATVRPDGGPHLVPIVFAFEGDRLVFAVDAKPKRTAALTRLANIAVEPRVTILVDHYEEDWDRLWWIRLDGTARIVREGPERAEALAVLSTKYEQYRVSPPPGPVVVVAIKRVTGWSTDPPE